MRFRYFRPPEGSNSLGLDVPVQIKRILLRTRGLPLDLRDDPSRQVVSNRTAERGWSHIRPAWFPMGERTWDHTLKLSGSGALEIRVAKDREDIHEDPDKREEWEFDALLENNAANILTRVPWLLARARHAKNAEEGEAARSRLRAAAIALGLQWHGRPDEERAQRKRWSAGHVRKVADLLRQARNLFRSRGYADFGGSADDEELEQLKRRVIWRLEQWAWSGGSPRLDLVEKDHQWVRLFTEEDPERNAPSLPLKQARRLVGVERGRE